MTRRLNIWLLSLLIIVGIPYYWYLIDPDAGSGKGEVNAGTGQAAVTMPRLRALAAASGAPLPRALRVETVGERSISGNMLVAGGGLRPVPTAVRAYQLVMPGTGPIVIDAGVAPEAVSAHDVEEFRPAAQRRVELALRRASAMVLLSDRPVHNGGKAPGAQHPPGDPALAPYALAPGVVVIPAAGLEPATRMIYVRLAGGREYLFTGDVAKMDANWRKSRLPARFATRDEPPGFRRANLAWLTTINALHRAAPQMVIVSGHQPGKVPFSAGTFSD